MSRRVLRLAIGIAAVGAFIAVALLVLVLVTAPGPRDTPGWQLLAPIPQPRGETTTVVVEGRIHVIGGLAGISGSAVDTVSVYDPSADAWSDAPPLPDPRHHAAAAVISSAVYVAGGASGEGGWSAQPALWRLDLGADAWTELTPMPEGRYGHRVVAMDGRLYVIGGVGGTEATLVYDPSTDAWAARAPLPAKRDHLAAVVVGEEIWAIGGRSAEGIHARVDIYDPAADVWRDGPALPAPTSGAAEAVVDGIILVSGGEDVSPVGEGVLDRHWWIDVRAEEPRWLGLPPPPLAIHGVQGAVVDGRFYVIGGATGAGGQSFMSWTDATQAFDLAVLGSQ